MADTAEIQLAQAPQRSTSPNNRQSPEAQLQSLVDGLGNGGTAYLSRIACMNGEMARRRDNNAPGFFDSGSNITVGQACRALMEFSADASARGNNTPAELLAPFRELVDFSSTNPNPQRNQAALALVNGLVNVSRNPAYANSTGTPMQLDGQGKIHQATPGWVMDARYSQIVSAVLAGERAAPNRISSWNETQVNNAVELCNRNRATLEQCSAIGQEVAAIYLQRRAGQAATR